MFVLALYNTSDYVAEPWLARGVTVVSIDLQNDDSEGENGHIRLQGAIDSPCDVDRVLADHGLDVRDVGVVISFAPCTDLASSGARWWAEKAERDPNFQRRAVERAKIAATFGVPYVVENPVGALSTRWRKPDMWTHPWEWSGYCPEGPHPEAPNLYPEGDRYCKKTGLWLGNGFTMPPPLARAPWYSDNPGWEKLGGKGERTKYLRSLTPRGMAEAFCVGNLHHVKQNGKVRTAEILAPSVDKSQQLEFDF